MALFLGGTIDGVPSNDIVWKSNGWAMRLIRQHTRDSALAHLALGRKLQSEHPCELSSSKTASSMIETRSSWGSLNILIGPVAKGWQGEGLSEEGLSEEGFSTVSESVRSMIVRSLFADSPRCVCRVARPCSFISPQEYTRSWRLATIN